MENGSTVYADLAMLQEAAHCIRKESQKGNLVEKNSLKNVAGIGEDNLEPLLARLPDFPEFMDLRCVIDGNGAQYLYSCSKMTDRYMEILIGLKNKKPLKLIAEMVRFESQAYPRPTRVDLFTEKPFSIGYEDLRELLDGLGEASEYSDLKFTEASNNARFLYSERHMTGFHAAKLAEWHAVLQHQTP